MKRPLVLATTTSLPLDFSQQIHAFREVGFDGFFTGFSPEIPTYRKLADELGMIYQSVHAPFDKAKAIWQADDGGAVDELLRCVRACHDSCVPLLIVHTYIGFEPNAGPTTMGLDHYGTVVDEARRLGVRIAFENTEGEEYLAALLDHFRGEEHVGFCWDSGHESCYNHSKDLLALYGDRLLGTHLNDNLGISRADGSIFWTDDLHLLPYDGVIDWDNVAHRLAKLAFDGPLTFELTTESKPNRHENDKYVEMGAMNYLKEAYARASKLEAAVRAYKG